MKVDFNNLRRQALHAYDNLAKKLNEGITPEGEIRIETNDISDTMEALRMTVGTIAMCYDPEIPDYKNVFEEVYPDGHEGQIIFNPDDL